MLEKRIKKWCAIVLASCICIGNFSTYASQVKETTKSTVKADRQDYLKAQAVSLADEIGKIFNLNPRFLFAIWYVESGLDLSYTGDMPDIYRDLVGVNTYRKYFTKQDVYKGKVNKAEKIAIGPFQYYTTWIDSELDYIFIPSKLANQAVYKQNGHMVKFDSNLGFNRPHPLYLPDAMFNVARLLDQYMKSHISVAATDKRFNNLPNDIKEQILFIYAGDRYHGDLQTAENYKNANAMHKALVSFYIDVYEKYGSLTNFFDGDRSKTRRIIMGDTSSSPNKGWTGKTTTKTVINGREFNRTLLEEMSKTTRTGYNYLGLFEKINNKDNKSNNRFGVAYGFEAMNGGFYYYDKWKYETTNVSLDTTNDTRLSEIRLFIDRKNIESQQETSKDKLRIVGYNKDTKEIKIGLQEYYGELGDIKGLLEVYPVKDAKVTSIGENDTSGKYITYSFKEGKDVYDVAYRHLSLIDNNLKKGDVIKSNKSIGVTGHTGNVSKPTLGIEIRKNGQPINPLEIYGLDVTAPKEEQDKWLSKYGFVLQ